MKKSNIFLRLTASYRLSILLLFLCGGIELYAQNNACMSELKSIYKKYNNLSLSGIPDNKVYYVNYTLHTATEDSATTGILKSDVITWMDQENLEVKSKEMEVYQNTKEAFIILPKKKLVMHNDAVRMDKKQIDNKVKRFQFIQDTVFSLSRVLSCSKVNSELGAVKRIELQVSDKGIALSNIRKLILDINETTNEFTRIKILYAANQQGFPQGIVWMEYKFNDVSFDYKKKLWTSNLSKLFLRSPKQLQEKYKGYELVDNRNKIIKTPQ